jgi:hypothetical protein
MQSIQNGYQETRTYINQTIQSIWLRASQAYYEPDKIVTKIEMPVHPQENTYPRQYKRAPWPHYLNQISGITPFDGSPETIESMAHNVEPLEKVTPLHGAVYKVVNLFQLLVNGLLGLQEQDMRVYRLIANEVPVDVEDYRGQTPAYWAAYFGNLTALMQLKIYGADLNKQDKRGKTPLRAAVKYGHRNVISFLATQKVDLNARDGRGLTPLHLAAYHGRVDICERLIYVGADRTLLDPSGRTAEEILKLKLAEKYHHYSFLRRLFSSPTHTLSLKSVNIAKLTELAQQ